MNLQLHRFCRCTDMVDNSWFRTRTFTSRVIEYCSGYLQYIPSIELGTPTIKEKYLDFRFHIMDNVNGLFYFRFLSLILDAHEQGRHNIPSTTCHMTFPFFLFLITFSSYVTRRRIRIFVVQEIVYPMQIWLHRSLPAI